MALRYRCGCDGVDVDMLCVSTGMPLDAAAGRRGDACRGTDDCTVQGRFGYSSGLRLSSGQNAARGQMGQTDNKYSTGPHALTGLKSGWGYTMLEGVVGGRLCGQELAMRTRSAPQH